VRLFNAGRIGALSDGAFAKRPSPYQSETAKADQKQRPMKLVAAALGLAAPKIDAAQAQIPTMNAAGCMCFETEP
jgi:hypothetical protein